MFISDLLAVNFLAPSHEIKVTQQTTFDGIASYITDTYKSFAGRQVEFRYINGDGILQGIPMSDKVVDYISLTDTIVVDGFFPKATMP